MLSLQGAGPTVYDSLPDGLQNMAVSPVEPTFATGTPTLRPHTIHELGQGIEP
jgi:hypothetical protein